MRKTTEPACPSLWLRATQEQLEHFIYASARFRFGESSDNGRERLLRDVPNKTSVYNPIKPDIETGVGAASVNCSEPDKT